MTQQYPSDIQKKFLDLAYSSFLEIHDELRSETFWLNDARYRLNRIRDAFLIYSEVLEYEPVGWFLEALKNFRPPLEAEMSKEFVLFLRNLLVHFPFFKSWDDIRFNKDLVNWSKPGRSIDKFLKQFAGQPEFKCRIWDPKQKVMTYLSVKFPAQYDDSEIQLSNIVSEKHGVLFAMTLMHRVLMSQVESIEEK